MDDDDFKLLLDHDCNQIINDIIFAYYYNNELDISLDIDSGKRLQYKSTIEPINKLFNNIVTKNSNYALINVYVTNDIIKKCLYNIDKIKKIDKIDEKTLKITIKQNIEVTHLFNDPQDLASFQKNLTKK
jgi:hypothetical protein